MYLINIIGGYKQKYEKFGNEIVATTIVQWVFKEKCAICISFIHHHKAGEFELPEVYIIMDDVIYSIDIQKLSGNKWISYKSNDLQLKLVPTNRKQLLRGKI